METNFDKFSLQDATNDVMKIVPFDVTIKEIIQNYEDNYETGAFCYGGALNLRPSYQREFCYSLKEMQEVIYSILYNHPINAMYFAENPDTTDYKTKYNCFDGQQRIISICKFANGEFAIECDDGQLYYISTLKRAYPRLYQRFMNYALNVYLTYGDLNHQIAWFKRINTYGERLTIQEIRNVSYTGPWLNCLKLYFSKPNCAGARLCHDYINGKVERQDFLEEILDWISYGEIDNYMQKHQYDLNADAEWEYVNKVINWVQTIFPNRYYREEMKGIHWGFLYNTYHDMDLDPEELENQVKNLMMDAEIKNKKGIYSYVLSGDDKYLNLRTFDKAQKRTMYEKQNGLCAMCKEHYPLSGMHGDHILPWSEGGKTELSNGQMLCAACNLKKSNKLIYYRKVA